MMHLFYEKMNGYFLIPSSVTVKSGGLAGWISSAEVMETLANDCDKTSIWFYQFSYIRLLSM